MPPVENEELVKRVLQGDREAHEEFVERYSRLIWALVRRILGTFSDAGRVDAYQEAFLRVIYKLPGWKGGNLNVWVARVVANRLIDLARRSSLKEIPLRDCGQMIDVHAADPADELQMKERQYLIEHCVERKLKNLPQPQRRLVQMLMDGMHPSAIHKALGVSRSTFYYWLRNIRQRLEECLEVG